MKVLVTGTAGFIGSHLAIKLLERGDEVVVYEPNFNEDTYFNSKVIKNLEEFKKISNVIVANRLENCLSDVKEKIYTRDIFNSDS